jgi:hypothetical protein
MSRSVIWFLLAFLWLVDGILSVFRHSQDQAIFVFGSAVVFFLIGVFVRFKEKRRPSQSA